MCFECNAAFVAYALLSNFAIITEKERDAVQFIIELIPCYDGVTGNLRMKFDTHVLAQIYLGELRVMAGRHSYTHYGSLEEAPQARALLNVVVMPLIRHLSDEEYGDLLGSLGEAYFLLSQPLDVLGRLVTMWRARNVSITMDWRSHPIGGLDNYQFGVELPGKLLLEDLLTPLPYPTKSSSAIMTSYTLGQQSEVDLTEFRKHLVDSSRTKAPPRSECAKELELKQKAKPNLHVLTIPFVGRSRGSSDSRSGYSRSSGSSEISWALANEGGDETNYPRRAPSRTNDQEAEAKHSRRKRFSHYVKMLFGHA